SLAGTPTWQGLTHIATTQASLVYDSAHDRALVYGGVTTEFNACSTNQTWTIPLTGTPNYAPRLVPATAVPAGVTRQSAVLDPLRNRVTVFGGEAPGFELSITNNTLALVLPSWPGPAPQSYDWMPFGSGPPSARYGHSAIRDVDADQMVVFGGNTFYDNPA